MSLELHYTSVPRGLKPGSRGFCTVAHSAGLAQALLERLESLSGYQHHFKPNDPKATLNPVAWSHLRLTGAGPTVSVLSRIGPAGLDYSERENKYAHHVVLGPEERPVGGPAWMLTWPDFMQASWAGAPRVLTSSRPLRAGDRPPAVCRAWHGLTGDAGWAGVVAEAFLADQKRVVALVYDPGTDVLSLFVEALSLLPPDRRWEVTFSTYFTGLPHGLACGWRGVLRGTSEVQKVRENPEALVIDLGPSIGKAKGEALVAQARTGERLATAQAASRPRTYAAQGPPRSQDEVSTSPRTSAPPQPASDYPFSASEPAPATPPPGPPTRTRRAVAPASGSSRGGGSPWPIVSVAAATFVLGLALGGAGTAIYLRSGAPARVELAFASGLEKDGPAPDRSKRELHPTIASGSKEEKKEAGPDHSKGNGDGQEELAKPKDHIRANAESEGSPKGLVAATPPEPSAGSTATKADNPPEDNPEKQAKSMEGTPVGSSLPKDGDPVKAKGEAKAVEGPSSASTGPTNPADNGTPTLEFFEIPLGDPDPTFGTGNLPVIKVAQDVDRLDLIGGADKDLKPYRFEMINDATHKDEYRVSEGESPSAIVGNFTAKNRQVTFEWEPSQGPLKPEMRGRFLDCVLAVRFEDGSFSYYWLRDPKITSLSRPLKQLPKNFPRKQMDWEFSIPFCSANSGIQPTKRILSLREFRITPVGKNLISLKPDGTGKNQLVTVIEPPDTTMKVRLQNDSHGLGELRVTLSPRPLADEEIKKLRSENNQRREILRVKINQMEMSGVRSGRGYDGAQEELLKLENHESENEETSRRATVVGALDSPVEAVVTLTAGAREFALPNLLSIDNDEGTTNGGGR